MDKMSIFHRLALLILVACLISGCGFHRYHQFVTPETMTEKPVEGWAITPSLERLEQGVSGQLEEYTIVVKAEIAPSRFRYRLGIDSVEVFQLDGRPLTMGTTELIFENQQTERSVFERRQAGLVLPTDIEGIICHLHVTMFDSQAQERWNRTIDYVFHSDWRKELWFIRR